MSDPAFYLSDQDRRDFNAMRQKLLGSRTESGQGWKRSDHTADQTPEVFLARTPAGGIPGTDVNGTGTTDDEVFGSATCTVYRVSLGGSGTGTADDDNLVEGAGQERRVFNLAAEPVGGETWILVSRDKFGVWWVAAVGASSGDEGSGWEKGRWVYVTSNDPNGAGYYPARLIDKDADGARTLGDEVRVKLLPYAGEEFVVGVYWVTFLRDSGGSAGTSDDYDLYDGVGNDVLFEPVCRDSVVEYDRVSIYHPVWVQENYGSADP